MWARVICEKCRQELTIFELREQADVPPMEEADL